MLSRFLDAERELASRGDIRVDRDGDNTISAPTKNVSVLHGITVKALRVPVRRVKQKKANAGKSVYFIPVSLHQLPLDAKQIDVMGGRRALYTPVTADRSVVDMWVRKGRGKGAAYYGMERPFRAWNGVTVYGSTYDANLAKSKEHTNFVCVQGLALNGDSDTACFPNVAVVNEATIPRELFADITPAHALALMFPPERQVLPPILLLKRFLDTRNQLSTTAATATDAATDASASAAPQEAATTSSSTKGDETTTAGDAATADGDAIDKPTTTADGNEDPNATKVDNSKAAVARRENIAMTGMLADNDLALGNFLVAVNSLPAGKGPNVKRRVTLPSINDCMFDEEAAPGHPNYIATAVDAEVWEVNDYRQELKDQGGNTTGYLPALKAHVLVRQARHIGAGEDTSMERFMLKDVFIGYEHLINLGLSSIDLFTRFYSAYPVPFVMLCTLSLYNTMSDIDNGEMARRKGYEDGVGRASVHRVEWRAVETFVHYGTPVSRAFIERVHNGTKSWRARAAAIRAAHIEQYTGSRGNVDTTPELVNVHVNGDAVNGWITLNECDVLPPDTDDADDEGEVVEEDDNGTKKEKAPKPSKWAYFMLPFSGSSKPLPSRASGAVTDENADTAFFDAAVEAQLPAAEKGVTFVDRFTDANLVDVNAAEDKKLPPPRFLYAAVPRKFVSIDVTKMRALKAELMPTPPPRPTDPDDRLASLPRDQFDLIASKIRGIFKERRREAAEAEREMAATAEAPPSKMARTTEKDDASEQPPQQLTQPVGDDDGQSPMVDRYSEEDLPDSNSNDGMNIEESQAVF